ncbi:low specificity L-threonine aldolase [Tannerella sp.]|uniref:threonine aldolase family protein n=1 Tax=Tannerella sp. TaxID=2382127 RepID=UPI0026DDCA0E|nr:low specificity L-threonine aldolase [Tannerella sp.]MDO4703905.1 low specificity L-threonine aldolase [Tannerella sp.]
MIRFECDYAEGAHPKILDRLVQTNFEQTKGYGEDGHCEHARQIIRRLCDDDQADVHFLVGGTQTNTTVIASVLRPHQGVISADSGHINVHETGAIEATGHKVLALPAHDGKLSAAQVEEAILAHRNDPNREHTVQPGMVYISQPTECGTLYYKEELQRLSEVCCRYGIPLFIDGARLGYGLEAETNDLTLPDIARLCDVFYIGGTKVGALFGEAVVILTDTLKQDFRYLMKQHGGMLAKGRLLGIQFETLFEDGLYFEISRHAVRMAIKIRDAFAGKGISFLYPSPTNQQFPILNDTQIAALSEKYAFEYWTKVDMHHTAVRFCTSWATREEDVDVLIEDVKNLDPSIGCDGSNR